MRRAFAALVALLLIPGSAWGAGRVDDKNTETSTKITFTFDNTVGTGVFAGRARGCSSFRVSFVPAVVGVGGGDVEIHAVPQANDPIDGANTQIVALTAAVAEPGAAYNATGDQFAFNVTEAVSGAGTAVVVIRCSNAQVSG
jgi:hypothetical protein